MRTPQERAAQWRRRAAEYRGIAKTAGNSDIERIYSDLARTYDHLADLVEEAEHLRVAAEKLKAQ
jgi:hypothetical protein